MSHDDFAVEPVPGLPERPPEGEHILWQGKPDWWRLSVESLSLNWIAGYFVFLAAWRFVTLVDQMTLMGAFAASAPLLIMGAVVCAILMVVGYVQARATLYTITNRRVAMRIGAALTVTLNLPYTQIGRADYKPGKHGTGTITFDLMGDTRLSYLVCWPHVRPWVMRRTQPALRCIPEAEKIAGLIAEAAETRIATPRIERATPQPAMAAE